MKWLTATFLFIGAAQCMVAGSEYPWSWSVTEQWSAHVIPFGKGWLIHRELPAWQSADPMLAVVDQQGKIQKRALDAEDLRAVAVWRSYVVVVRTTTTVTDVVVLDSNLSVISTTPLIDKFLDPNVAVEISLRTDKARTFVSCGSLLFSLDMPTMQRGAMLIEQGVFGMTIGSGRWLALLVHDVGGMAYARMIDTGNVSRVMPSVPLAQRARIGQIGDEVVIISPVDVGMSSQVSVLDAQTGDVRTITMDVPANLITWTVERGRLSLVVVRTVGGRQVVTSFGATTTEGEAGDGVVLPAELGVPEKIWSYADTIVVQSAVGIATITDNTLISCNLVGISLHGYERGSAIGQMMLLSGSGRTVLLSQYRQPWSWLWWFITVAGPFVLPALLIALLVVQTIRLRRQRSYLNAMLQVPGAGLVFVLDAAGKLLRTNEQAAQLLRISNKVPMGRLYNAYMRHGGVAGIQKFVNHAVEVRRPVSEKVAVNDDDNQREYMVTAQPLWSTLSRYSGLVVTGIDITEALERRRLVNWAQLAHDMQTNLSTIRLNAEQLDMEMESRDKERVRRILFQTGVLIQRVRDLVSIGRSEELQRSSVHSAEFCTQIRHEFDPAMFPHVNFVMKLRGTMMNIDKLKLSRAVRNAVENAIKSMRGVEGTIEISTWFDRTHVFISIADTGVGMDTLTLENMMKPYFTTAKDGSGTGIGTMIMQHVTHLHGGSLRVTSEPGKGTQVVFRIPIGDPL